MQALGECLAAATCSSARSSIPRHHQRRRAGQCCRRRAGSTCLAPPPAAPAPVAALPVATHRLGRLRDADSAANRAGGRAALLVAAAASAAEAGGVSRPVRPGVEPAAAQAQVVLLTACVAMAMAAVHRVAFSVLSIPIQAELGLSLPQMGTLQSALLMGYVVGQVPCGVLADRFGGAHLAAAGLFLWSSVCLLFSRATSSSNPFMALVVVRAALGLAQSCIMPAMAALSARWFPPAIRSRCTSVVYSSYSFGTVAGLALTPLVAEHVGWGATFTVFGLAGMAAAAASSLVLPPEGRTTEALQPRQVSPAAAAAAAEAGSSTGRQRLSREDAAHLLLLSFTHSVISFSFFILQAWIPSFLASIGMSQLSSIGLLSSLPWLATAVVAVLAGGLADRLQAHHGWATLRVRHAMHAVAMGGTALSLSPLALPGVQLGPLQAAAALTAAVAFQGFSYAGFHSYVPEVAPDAAGFVLSITNTCGTLVGIAGNLLTGVLAGSSSGYTGMFALTMVLQILSLLYWLAGAHGRPLRLRGAQHE